MESNERYYSRRAAEERRAAARAITAEARARHTALAQLFSDKARDCARAPVEAPVARISA